MSSNSPLVPKLRFPDFRGTGGWAISKLGSIGFFTGGGTPSKDKADYWIGVNPWVSSSDVSEDGIHDISISRYISDEAIQATATKVVPPNSILLVSRVGVGKLAISRTPICTSQDFTNFTPAKDDLVFLAYCIKSLKAKLLAFNQGMAIKGFTKDDVSNLGIPLPKLAEQQKIADCLSSLDELIVAQARKVDALKTHKKGLMQQLFPREGETQPRLRFPGFRDAGGWSLTTLGKHIQLQSGYAFSSEYFGRAGQKLVTPKNFTKFGFGNFDESISKYTTEEAPQKYVCKPGDLLILLTDLTPTCELLGKPLEVLEQDGNVLLNQRVAKVEPVSNDVLKTFLKQLFLTEPYTEVIVETASGSTVKHSSNKVLLNMEVALPCVDEQRQIADCLSSLDTLITAAAQQLEAHKAHKKGLMQQIFPSMEEAV